MIQITRPLLYSGIVIIIFFNYVKVLGFRPGDYRQLRERALAIYDNGGKVDEGQDPYDKRQLIRTDGPRPTVEHEHGRTRAVYRSGTLQAQIPLIFIEASDKEALLISSTQYGSMVPDHYDEVFRFSQP